MTTLVASPAQVPTGSSHPFTCNTCQVAFKSSEGQRNHMHTDWHRYNLKRKITELPPISSEVFAEKVLSSQADARAAHDRASFERGCQACSKTYYSQNAFNNHVNSQKHKQRLAALQRGGFGDGTESVMSSTFSMDDTEDGHDVDHKEKDLSTLVGNLKLANSDASTPKSATPGAENPEVLAGKELPITECLFCGQIAPTLQQNLEHMSKIHGLFVPEQRYLVNLEGLIRYLGQKVLIGNTCLYCNKAKGGLEGIRTHMRDKGHCMIAFETEEEMVEIGEFYDFRSTYNDDFGDEDEEDEWEDESGNKTKGHDETWETDSDDSSVNSEDIGSLKVTPGRRPRTSSSHHLEDGWHSHAHSHSHTHAIYFTETEMHLPSGRSVGHRSLARYYRQNLRDHPQHGEQSSNQLVIEDGDAVSEEEEAQTTAQRRHNKALISRANGGQGLALASATAKSQAAKLERKDKAIAERGRERYRAKIEKANNSQKHFRDPLLQ